MSYKYSLESEFKIGDIVNYNNKSWKITAVNFNQVENKEPKVMYYILDQNGFLELIYEKDLLKCNKTV